MYVRVYDVRLEHVRVYDLMRCHDDKTCMLDGCYALVDCHDRCMIRSIGG